MRKFTLFALSALIIGMGEASAQTQSKTAEALTKGLFKRPAAIQNKGKKQVVRADAAPSLWLATHDAEYDYNPDTQEWEFMADYYTKYDTKGNAIQSDVVEAESTDTTRRVTTFNEDNQPTYQLDTKVAEGGKVTNLTKRTQEYDNIVKNLITRRTTATWNETTNDWDYNSNNYIREVTRNADGNVTSCVVSTLYEGKYDPSEKITIEYDANTKQAVNYRYDQLTADDSGNFVWELQTGLKNIVWEKTNGQIVGPVTDLYEGDNRIKSATIYDQDGNDAGTLTINYTENGYTLTATQDGTTATTSKNYTDSNGSYEVTTTEYTDANGDGTLTSDEKTYEEQIKETYDDHKNIKSYEYYAPDEEATTLTLTLMEGSKYENIYDEATGCLKQYTQSDYDMDEKGYTPFMKIVFDNFVDVANPSGITTNTAAGKGTRSEVYNIQGVKVGDTTDNLPAGLYIMKQNGKTTKVLKK